MYDPEKTPDLSGSFPKIDPELKVKEDLGNEKHGPHYDVLKAIEGGTDQVRVSETGDVMGGTTNFGKAKMQW